MRALRPRAPHGRNRTKLLYGMRIIAGTSRGRRLKVPDTDLTRPMLDRQKQALFDILQREFPCDGVLDLFAGSGGLGLEAISRGAARATLVERGREALQAIRENIAALGCAAEVQVIARDVFQVEWARVGHPISIAFIDAPFPLALERGERLIAMIEALLAAPNFAAEGVIVHRVPVSLALPEAVVGGRRADERVFGESRIGFYRRQD